MKTVPSTNRVIPLHPEGARRFPKGDRKALWRGVGQSPTLQGIALDRRSFSGLRKNQRGPEGVSQFIPPGDTPSGLPPFPLSKRVIGLNYPQAPRGGGPFRGRSDGVRVRRRCAARRNCCGDTCLMPVTRFCRSNQGAFRSLPGPLRSASL